jgi:hypothetical protein
MVTKEQSVVANPLAFSGSLTLHWIAQLVWVV